MEDSASLHFCLHHCFPCATAATRAGSSSCQGGGACTSTGGSAICSGCALMSGLRSRYFGWSGDKKPVTKSRGSIRGRRLVDQRRSPERALGQAPVAVGNRLFFGWQRVFRVLRRVCRALRVCGVVAQPKLPIVLAPTAQKIVKSAATRVPAGEMRWIAQTALPKRIVKLSIAQVIGMQDVKTVEGNLMVWTGSGFRLACGPGF
jgi:hypothetical protein